VRDGQPVEVARESLTLTERRIIHQVLNELGEAKLREADALTQPVQERPQ